MLSWEIATQFFFEPRQIDGLKEQELKLDQIIAELEAERDRLAKVIAVLAPKKSRGRRKGRRLSASARKRISEGMRRNWAARKERPKE